MNTFRAWSRRAYVLHGYLIASLVLLPVRPVSSTWTDTDSDNVNDTWEDTANSTSYSLAALNTISQDIDGDGAFNDEELAAGSDPFDMDTDDDGLSDGDEIHLANQQAGRGYSLTAWDSNGDAVSDHDDFYGCFSVTYPGGQLPAFSGATYSDYDGDGVKNPFDSYPADPLNNDADNDGINDSSDPALGDNTNTSTVNGQPWGSNALGDQDGDNILNFWDLFPADASNGSSDSDADGLPNTTDPFPEDYSNYSLFNGIYWYGDVLGDADWDGTSNYTDYWPYDASNGATGDSDGDGLQNSLDPAPNDANNHSSANGSDWYAYALEDADNDGTDNFHDTWPYDTFDNLPDFDGDGWVNADDPFPKDATNFSSLNQTAWHATLFGDADGDQTVNWQDEFPTDPYNNQPDVDGDGILNASDPYPRDVNNLSPVNNIAWLGTVNGDDDFDGVPNWNDPSPYTVDTDGDGIDDVLDPFDNDSSNTSPVNNTAWWGAVLEDNDNDGTPNWNDSTPYPVIADSDGDGISDADDPFDFDATNTSQVNGVAWGANVLLDQDVDGLPNWNDPDPIDSDGDGWSDGVDPFDNDPWNYSSINNTWWQADVLGNADGDSMLNWEDPWPSDSNNGYVNPDRDGDGYANEQDPAPDDAANYSPHNWQSWYGSALADNDNDGTANFYDYDPNQTYYYTVDSDWDGIFDSNDPAPNDPGNYSSINGQWWHTSALSDIDSDGTNNFNDPEPYGPPPPVDNDGDGLNADQESAQGTSDSNVDSDNDGLSDGEEVNIHGTSPVNAHHLSQQRFNNTRYTDWQLVDHTDTDGDQIPDRVEQHYNLNVSWPKDALLDRDNDGVNNLAQYNAGRALDDALSSYDADEDGMTDVFEDAHQLARNSPADAVQDADGDGVLNHEEMVLLLSPRNADTLLLGGLGDLQMLMLNVRYPQGVDPPGDDVNPANGIPDWAEAMQAAPSAPDHWHFTRQAADDLDGDGLPDAWEHQFGRWKFPINGLQPRYADAAQDADGDGLSNLYEYFIGTSPLAGDSDGDNIADTDEDFDGDGLSNGFETRYGLSIYFDEARYDYDWDGLTNLMEQKLGLDPLGNDSDGDGVLDGDEDADLDGLTNLLEQWLSLNPTSNDSDGDGVLDGDEDTDMDGVSNAAELADNDPLTDPADSCNGVEPYVENINYDAAGQLMLKGALAEVPMKFKITRWNETTYTSEPWVNLPVVFEVTDGPGTLENEAGTQAGASKLLAFTDATGHVTARFRGAALKATSKVRVSLLRLSPGLSAQASEYYFWTSQCTVDADDDGLDDVWEAALIAASGGLFASIADVRPEDDFDRDGVPNVYEFDRGTDPANPAAFPNADVVLDHTGAAHGNVPVVQTWEAAVEAAASSDYGEHPENRGIIKLMPGTYNTAAPQITRSALLWGQGSVGGGLPVLTSTNSYGPIIAASLYPSGRRGFLKMQGVVLDGGGMSNLEAVSFDGAYSPGGEAVSTVVFENCIVRNCPGGGIRVQAARTGVNFTTITGCGGGYASGITLYDSYLTLANSIMSNLATAQEVWSDASSSFDQKNSVVGTNPGITSEGRLLPGVHVWNLLAEGSAPPVDIDGEQRVPLAVIGADQISDSDGDGVPDALEVTQGTLVFLADSDGDGVNDLADPLPLDPAVSVMPGLVSVPGPPVVQLMSPASAVLVP